MIRSLTVVVLFAAENHLSGDLPETLKSMEYLSKVHLEGNRIDFATNVNEALCHKSDSNSEKKVLTVGFDDCSSCLCCTDCPDAPGNLNN